MKKKEEEEGRRKGRKRRECLVRGVHWSRKWMLERRWRVGGGRGRGGRGSGFIGRGEGFGAGVLGGKGGG